MSDPGATFDLTHAIDATSVRPQVTWGTSPEMVVSIEDRVPDPDQERDETRRDWMERALTYMGLAPNTPITDIHIDKVFIGSCTNSRIEDLRQAAAVIRGHHIADNVKLALVVPGSDRKSTRLNSSHMSISYAVFCLKKKKKKCEISKIKIQ